MSLEKRQWLIEQGLLNPDGSRITKCPTCQHVLTEEEYNNLRGANPETVVAETSAVEKATALEVSV